MQTDSPVLTHRSDDVLELVLNRPERLNAMNVPFLRGLQHALREAASDPSIGAVLLHAEGRAFCVGEDLRETLAPESGTAEELRKSFDILQDLTRLMTAAPFAIVAVVDGWAIGGGAELALAADFLIAGTTACFRFPEVTLGHAPTGGVTQRLTAAVGLMTAKDWLLTGRDVGVEEARQAGLLWDVSGDPLQVGRQFASELAGKPRRSLASTKRLVELAAAPQLETVLQSEVDAANWCFASHEAEASFVDFRKRSGDVSSEAVN